MLTLAADPAELTTAGQSDSASPPGLRARQFANMAVLAILFAAPAAICAHAACVWDPDIWWHLRTGEWIQQHHAIPRFDVFSRTNAGQPWQPYSWLYELLVIRLFQTFGLAGIVGFSASMVFAMAIAMQRLIHRLQPDFLISSLLTFATFFTIEHLFTPRPWMFTILFFVLELHILIAVRRTGRTKVLAWLPILFAAWANIHVQFIDGLIVLGIALADSTAARWHRESRTALTPAAAAAALTASILATLANPFGWHIYRVAYDLATQSGVLNKISELQAMSFRNSSEFCMVFLALAAASAIAWHRRFTIYEVLLLAFGVLVSFRSSRDMWVLAIVAIVILASNLKVPARDAISVPFAGIAAAALAGYLLLLACFPTLGVRKDALDWQVAHTLPLDAVKAIQQHRYAGPLYNNFDWGGFLIWQLRMPVTIDGRAAFYGDDAIDRSVATWNGSPEWASDPLLQTAGVVIGPRGMPLVQLLRTDAHFQLVYEDKLAAVFVARR